MIYTTGLSEDFADKLTAFILEKHRDNPFDMAQTHVILPTKRACLMVREAFLRASQNHSLLLPQMSALYELDNLDENLPAVMPSLNRTLLLARLCAKKPNITGMDKALMIAIGLGELLDEFYQYEADINDLTSLVQEKQFAEHWNETVAFLDIIHTEWPKILAHHSQIDEMDYRIRMIKSYAKKWRENPPEKSIIMAGFDGAIPAVIELASVIHALPNGILFLNGADTSLTTEEFNRLPPIHAQYPLKRLLDGVRLKPSDIKQLNATQTPTEHLMWEMLKPTQETDKWQHVQGIDEKALSHVRRFYCETTDEEARCIALLLRNVLETPEKTAAFVTTDRALARRVALEMKRWGILLDDSAGVPLRQTPVGIYLMLLVKLALNPQDGHAWLALLKHPLSADLSNPAELRYRIKSAEKTARKDNIRFQYQTKVQLDDLFETFKPNTLKPFSELLKMHIQMAERLASSHDRVGFERLWANEAGQTAYTFLTDLMAYADLLGDIETSYYPKVLELLINGLNVRPKYGMHPRLDILGPIEARLHHADVMIVGGLNEGTFPQSPDVGPWLNRPMRQALGLPAPENKIAVAGMDFAMCFCAKEVYLTRSLKTDGAQTIPSRFLSRLEAVLNAAKISWPVLQPTFAKIIDKPSVYETIIRPAPKPPVSCRPNRLSVTKIELWMRDPYAIYARYILKLYKLNDLEAPKKQQLFGNAIHKTLEQFLKEDSHSLDLDKLIKLGQKNLMEHGFDEADMAFYLPKFHQIAKWFLNMQSQRIHQIKTSFVEQIGETDIQIDDGTPFTLYGTADRIDLLNDGTVEIIDYKTGTVSTKKEVVSGYAPQLPLEGYIATQGGFKDIGAREISNLSYWKVSGKNDASAITTLMNPQKDESDLIETTYHGVKRLITTFNDENVAYESCPAPEKAPRYNDYEHLSRAKEWQTTEDEENEI